MEKIVYILSGPAGVGKTTLWEAISQQLNHIGKIITTTSRPIRAGEKNGVDYHFLTREQFEEKISEGDFIEYAIVHTNLYGSTYSELDRILANKKSPIYIIEPQGMIHLKPLLEKKGYIVRTIFLIPPSIDELKNRLSKRGTETEEQFKIRLATAISELEQKDFYDIQIINDDFMETQKDLVNIFNQSKQ